MFCQLLGVCESQLAKSALNETLDGNLDNDTISTILNNGTIPRRQIYQMLEYLGFNTSENGTIRVNLTD